MAGAAIAPAARSAPSAALLMMLLFFHVYFAPYRRLCRALDAEDLPAAAKQLAQIRRIVGINMLLGLATIVVATSGRYWSGM